jgi:Domain of unknown function (DUF222)
MPGADNEVPAQPSLQEAASRDSSGDDTFTPAATQGLSWSWGLDFEKLLAVLNEPAPWNLPTHPAPVPAPARATLGETDTDRDRAPEASPATETSTNPAPEASPAAEADTPEADAPEVDPVEADLAEYLEAVDAGRSRVLPIGAVAGRIAESLPTGPDLAGWLAVSSVDGLEDGALAGTAASYRRLASWAQAGELAVVAELVSRSAAADHKIGVNEQGRPARVPEEASAQVSLALTMSQASASWWSDLGVSLAWQLAATGAALRSGQIDLGRARLIAEMTGSLDDETARAVEARVLPRAGDQTMGQLRAALRRAVIVADPEGAERRREEAERRAKVALYPDPDGTASLAGYNLPSIRAASAMARITALARAMKASGVGGGIDLLRAQVFLGLLLGTLPYIPPAPDSPPDDPSEDPPGEDLPADLPGEDLPSEEPASEDLPGEDLPAEDLPAEDLPADPTDQPAEEGTGDLRDEEEDYRPGSRTMPAWPEVKPFLPPAPAAMGNLSPVGGGLLDLRVPWATMFGNSSEPGHLGRIGPITPVQARHLADLAISDPAVQWRVIVTSHDGQAQAVTRVSRVPIRAGPRGSPADAADAPPGNGSDQSDCHTGLVGRVTVTISRDDLDDPPPDELPAILARVLRAAEDAAQRADLQIAADAEAAGRCAHGEASTAYRPPTRVWEYVTARDMTCRFPTCRQPAWRCDLDHTTPYDKGGKTCPCNLGGLCRFHHQLKQHVLWRLAQRVPGVFTWTTPVGRTYVAEPDLHPV